MGRPVCNRTYSAVIPCIRVQPPTASSHIKSPKKGHGSPFSTRALVFYHMLYENATTFGKKVRKKSRNFSDLFCGKIPAQDIVLLREKWWFTRLVEAENFYRQKVYPRRAARCISLFAFPCPQNHTTDRLLCRGGVPPPPAKIFALSIPGQESLGMLALPARFTACG